MANPEHVEIVKKGSEAITAWREEHPDEAFDLDGAQLSFANLAGTDLSGASLVSAKLIAAILDGADLGDANLIGADLSCARLRGAKMWGARLRLANLERADLSGACLTNADLSFAQLDRSQLRGANLGNAIVGSTRFIHVDLSSVEGLETVDHRLPSMLGIDTLLRFKDRIPPTFLRGCGLPESLVKYLPKVLTELEPVHFCACFIMCSEADLGFTRQLRHRLQQEGVCAWLDPSDGACHARFRSRRVLHTALHEPEGLLFLVLSETSIGSEWLKWCLAEVFLIWRGGPQSKLVPISLVSPQIIREWTCPREAKGDDLAERFRESGVHDFSKWRDQRAFATAFAALLRDLKARVAN